MASQAVPDGVDLMEAASHVRLVRLAAFEAVSSQNQPK
jgi:hypothetical protein